MTPDIFRNGKPHGQQTHANDQQPYRRADGRYTYYAILIVLTAVCERFREATEDKYRAKTTTIFPVSASFGFDGLSCAPGPLNRLNR